ncbi:FGGY family of carbohydrate kinases, C-terminal domain [Nesidiocoris tenuis]|uniref:Xylulose kinase n=1 Tax=Nesidiocoris tenuis TaxID=355587 RepID=A0ABN7AZE8_9HEMI|nr:FGGY family of carbohydrate kinases, C-terminal domain [Nesidiocoris tenuis]
MTSSEPLAKQFLGFDLSTQQLKGVVINEKREVLHESHVQFDTDLPEFRTHNGVITVLTKGQKPEVSAPVLMWVKALDMILERLRVCGADFSQIASLSGSAQQHGTVYWVNGAEETLKSLDEGQFLHNQMATSFASPTAPVWLDSSTTAYSQKLEESVGGPEELAIITGSKAYERFSASQIAKVASIRTTVYNKTERISLVSSFMCSLFLGKYAAIDYADGSGMNLLDIKSKEWSPQLLEATAPGLAEKLGDPVPSHSVLGQISNYFVERFGFNEECDVVAFTGDNPSSLAGMCLEEGDMAISLGTSDTLFMWLKEQKYLENGSVFVNPLNETEYMGLLCYKNGSLVRERIKDKCTKSKGWEEFGSLLQSTPWGNFGYMGLYFDEEEIVHPVQGEFKFDQDGRRIEKFDSHEVEIRALVEGQFLLKRLHLEDLDIPVESFSRIVATGGASQNQMILQVIADVFNAPVYTLDNKNSALLGAAYRALDSYSRFAKAGRKNENGAPLAQGLTLVCSPYSEALQIYTPMVEKCRAQMKSILPSIGDDEAS